MANIEELIQRIARETGQNPELIRAMIQQESGGKPGAVSPKGAQGLMQLMPGTAKAYGVTDPFNLEQNIRGGSRYMGDLIKMFGGDLSKALAGYNAGPGNVRKYGGIPPFKETQNYVPSVLNRMGGNQPAPPGGKTYSVAPPTSTPDVMTNMYGQMKRGELGQGDPSVFENQQEFSDFILGRPAKPLAPQPAMTMKAPMAQLPDEIFKDGFNTPQKNYSPPYALTEEDKKLPKMEMYAPFNQFDQPQSAYDEFNASLPPRPDTTPYYLRNPESESDLFGLKSLYKTSPKTGEVGSNESLGNISQPAGVSGRTGADKKTTQESVFVSPENKTLQRYLDFLETMPQRSAYEPSTASRIWGALYAGSQSLRSHGGDPNAVYKVQELLDRPYNEALGDWTTRAKLLGAGTEAENRGLRTADDYYRTMMQDRRLGAMEENYKSIDEWRKAQIEREQKESEAKLKGGYYDRTGTTDKPVAQMEQDRVKFAAAVKVITENPEYTEFVGKDDFGRLTITPPAPGWSPEKLEKFKSFMGLVEPIAATMLNTTRKGLTQPKPYVFQR